jgi:SET domain-containing protein
MLMVKTRIGPSTIPDAGLGLFADEFIPEGKVTWRFCPGFDLVLSEDDLLRLSEQARRQFLNYCYFDKVTKHFILCGDDERFINHSESPNVMQGKEDGEIEGVEIAGRDILPGEELFCDYFDFDEDAARKLERKDIYKYLGEPVGLEKRSLRQTEQSFQGFNHQTNLKQPPRI